MIVVIGVVTECTCWSDTTPLLDISIIDTATVVVSALQHCTSPSSRLTKRTLIDCLQAEAQERLDWEVHQRMLTGRKA